MKDTYNKFLIYRNGNISSDPSEQLACPATVNMKFKQKITAFKAFRALDTRHCCVFDLQVVNE